MRLSRENADPDLIEWRKYMPLFVSRQQFFYLLTEAQLSARKGLSALVTGVVTPLMRALHPNPVELDNRCSPGG